MQEFVYQQPTDWFANTNKLKRAGFNKMTVVRYLQFCADEECNKVSTCPFRCSTFASPSIAALTDFVALTS